MSGTYIQNEEMSNI